MSKRKQTYFIALGGFLVLAVLVGGVVFPLFGKVKKTGEEIKDSKATLAFVGEQKGYYYKLSNDFELLKKEFDSIPKPFLEPDPTKAVNFVEFMENTAGAYNLQLEFKGFSKGKGVSNEDIKKIKAAAGELLSVSAGAESKKQKEETDKETLPFLVYNIELQGEFADIVKFLINLENSQYYSQVDLIKMKIIEIAKTKENKVSAENAEAAGGEEGKAPEAPPSKIEKIQAEIEGRVYLDPTLEK